MLVLSRRVNERLLIPCVRAAIQVIAAGPGSVRLGIEAPPHVKILREELAPPEGWPGLTEHPSFPYQPAQQPVARPGPGACRARDGKTEGLLAALDALGREFQALCEQLDVCAPNGPAVWNSRWRPGRPEPRCGSNTEKTPCITDREEVRVAPVRAARPGWRPRLREGSVRPLRPGRVMEVLPPPRPAPASRAAARSLLIVDDDAFARDALAQILEAEGYAVACAANGREALRRLRQLPLPDLILLDLVMPVLDGFSFCRLQERDARLASIPVVVVSARDVSLGAAESAPQVVGCVSKPIAVEELLECIRQCF